MHSSVLWSFVKSSRSLSRFQEEFTGVKNVNKKGRTTPSSVLFLPLNDRDFFLFVMASSALFFIGNADEN